MEVVKIKVNLRIVDKGNYVFLPKHLRQVLTKEITAIPNMSCVVMYPKNANLDYVIASLETVKRELENLKKFSEPKEIIPILESSPFTIERNGDTILFKCGELTAKVGLSKLREFIEKHGLEKVLRGLQGDLMKRKFPAESVTIEELRKGLKKVKVI